jgi:predicted ATP-grasp superfamily ATP-dependent carboligase
MAIRHRNDGMSAANLLIIGASARAAAFSALRAGLNPWCADLFADADLAARCPVQRVAGRDYPDAFHALAASAPAGPWMYTGGIENHRDLVWKLARERMLWGNNRRELEAVRSPQAVARALAAAGIPHPALFYEFPERVPSQGRWLIKPWDSAGGAGIHWLPDGPRRASGRRQYLQEFIDGDACAAVYVASDEGTQLVGITRQLVGEPFCHAGSFQYCGSIGPLEVTEAERAAFERLGKALARAFGLRGLFGVDCVRRDGVPFAVDVNPRYTASVEVLEYAHAVPILAVHRAAFDPGAETLPSPAQPRGRVVGKAILFARQSLTFPGAGPWMTELRRPGDVWDMPAFADIPHAGEPIEARKPILTFFAGADSVAQCLEALKRVAVDLERWLFGL